VITPPSGRAHTIVFIQTVERINILGTGDADATLQRLETRQSGRHTGKVGNPEFLLGEGLYSLTVSLSIPHIAVFDRHAEVVIFEVVDILSKRRQWQHQRRPGLLGPEIPWQVLRAENPSPENGDD